MQHLDAKIIYVALDKLMRCKGKQLMDSETKSAWIEYLMPYELDHVIKGIDKLITIENPWPEVATIIKYAEEAKKEAWKIDFKRRMEIEKEEILGGTKKEIGYEN